MDYNVKYGLDAVALGATVATLIEILPPIAALLSIIWLSIQIISWAVKQFKGRK